MPGRFTTPLPVLRPASPQFRLWILCSPVEYVTTAGEVIQAEPGFVTDLTTAYREGPWSQAAIIHDWLLVNSQKSRRESDHIFREAVLACGCSRARAWCMWLGVRAGAVQAILKRLWPWRSRSNASA